MTINVKAVTLSVLLALVLALSDCEQGSAEKADAKP